MKVKLKESKIDKLSIEEQEELVRLLEENKKHKDEHFLDTFYRDKGLLRRKLYKKHMEFFAAGGNHKILPSCPKDCNGKPHAERCFLAANRIGKTIGVGAYEMTLHLTGRYPHWWVGKRFSHPVMAWAAGDISQTTRDIIQLSLLGQFGSFGTGMIPKEDIIHTATKGGLAAAVETIYVRHQSGGRSELGLKSYDQGRLAFQGTNRHIIWLDEECHRDIYTECLIRTMTVKGIIMLTFTPLRGMTDVVKDFLGINNDLVVEDTKSVNELEDTPKVKGDSLGKHSRKSEVSQRNKNA